MSELKLENFTLSYFGHADAIRRINHVFSDGVNCVFAPEGSGKTSLLKGIAGLNEFHDGTLELDGAPLTYGSSSQVSMVFDDLGLFEKRTVKYNLEYPLRLRKYPQEEIDTRIKEGMDLFGLPELVLSSKAFRVSEENRVKAALVRAFYRDSEVLLLDDPLRGLSPGVRRKLFLDLVLCLKKRKGIVIYATDDWQEIETLSAPTLVLSSGYALECGLPQEIALSPKCLSTAIAALPYYNVLRLGVCGEEVELLGEKVPTFLPEIVQKSFSGKELYLGFPPEAVGGDITTTLPALEFLRLPFSKEDTYTFFCKGIRLFSSKVVDYLSLDVTKITVYDGVTEVAVYPLS